jgi:hypothetical protein
VPKRVELNRDVSPDVLVEELGLEYDFELVRIALQGPAAFAVEGGRSRLRPDMTMSEFLRLLPGDAPRRFVEFYAPLYEQKNHPVSV